MTPREAEDQMRRRLATLGTLRAARKAIEPGPPAGVYGLDIAIASHETGARELVEAIAKTDWWDPYDIPALAALIPLAVGLVGVNDSVVRLAVSIGRLSQPRAPFDEAA